MFQLTIVTLLAFPFYAYSVKHFFGKLRELTRKRSQALANVQSYLHERVTGVSVIKSFALEEEEQEAVSTKRMITSSTKAIDHTKWNAKAFAVVNTITDVAPLSSHCVCRLSSYQWFIICRNNGCIYCLY